MKALLTSLLGRATDLAQSQPLLALCLGAALFATFLSLWLRQPAAPDGTNSLLWTLYYQAKRFLVSGLALLLVIAATLGLALRHNSTFENAFLHTADHSSAKLSRGR